MTTLPPPKTNYFPPDTLEKQVYNLVEELKDYLPIMNDRNRLGFSLFKFMKGEGDDPSVLVKTQKLTLNGITPEELAKKLSEGLAKIKV
ncbi:MAG: hypothetical protein Kow0098_06030 [Ignavibacteriaceae bacterium]